MLSTWYRRSYELLCFTGVVKCLISCSFNYFLFISFTLQYYSDDMSLTSVGYSEVVAFSLLVQLLDICCFSLVKIKLTSGWILLLMCYSCLTLKWSWTFCDIPKNLKAKKNVIPWNNPHPNHRECIRNSCWLTNTPSL